MTHHPQCDGIIERLNHMFKTMLQKQAVKFGAEWDTYLPGTLWAYHNTLHTSTGENPSYLLFGYDCHFSQISVHLPKPLCCQLLYINLLTSVIIEKN